METEAEVVWTVVNPRKKKPGNSILLEPLKRKCPSPVGDEKENMKKKNTNNIQNIPTVRIYPEAHSGPALVEIRLAETHCKKSRSHNMVAIAKALHSMKAGAHQLRPRGFNKAEAMFNNGMEANRLILSPKVGECYVARAMPQRKRERIKIGGYRWLNFSQEHGLEAFVPRHSVERKGLLKGFSLEYPIEDLLDLAVTPCKIIQAKRMDRRQVDSTTKEVSWVPSETVLITFEGSTLPTKIQLYGLLNKNIEPDIERVRTCKNCGKFGHSQTRYRSLPECLNCSTVKAGYMQQTLGPRRCIYPSEVLILGI
uniref:uncharacterized protein LOC117609791 n=1 Tax=Osmia lignaria TaxID=473952 RepID=UPI001479073B|nr:uncharacterized protein LOC117609791 [Osmia lignaria]